MAGYRPHLTASPPCYHRIPPTDTHLTGSRGSCLPSTLPRQLAGTGRSEWPVFPGSGRAHWEAGARRLRLRQIELATVSRTLLASLTFRSRWPSWDQLEIFFFRLIERGWILAPIPFFLLCSAAGEVKGRIRFGPSCMCVLVMNQHRHDIDQTTIFSFQSRCHISRSSQLRQCENLNIAALTHKWHLSHA